MKGNILLITFVICLLLAEGLSEKVKRRRVHKKVDASDDNSQLSAEENDVFQQLEKDEEVEKLKEENSSHEVDSPPVDDPCREKTCGAGRVCRLNENLQPQCVCIPRCLPEPDPRRKVCSNHNETWGSDCEVYQMRCWCDHGDQRCKREDYKHLHIDYYGACRDMPPCTEPEMADFPRRMREWLFNIMRDMADRKELSSHYYDMEREAETNMTRRWSNAAIWKWCDLDGHPHDRTVSRHELFPIRAPLMSLEHCIAPFLNSCDANDDHRVTLKEWGKCLELPEDDIEERCEDLQEELKRG